jgi:hypothetical protein
MTYDCHTLECVADEHILKLQCLQSRVLCTTGNLNRCRPVQKLYWASKFLTCMTEVILNHVKPREAKHMKYKRLRLGTGRPMTIQLIHCSFRVVT